MRALTLTLVGFLALGCGTRSNNDSTSGDAGTGSTGTGTGTGGTTGDVSSTGGGTGTDAGTTTGGTTTGGTTTGGTGDDAGGTGTVAGELTISEIQQSTESTGCFDAACTCNYQGGDKACKDAICNLKDNQKYTIKGAIVASPSFYVSATKRGFYLAQEGGGAFGGVAMTYNADWTPTLEVGKKYDVEVRVAEAFCNTQVDLANLTGIVPAGAATPPAPEVVDASAFSGTDIEKWEGMQVTVKNVTVMSQETGSVLKCSDGVQVGDAFSIWFKGGAWTPPPVGTVLKSVTGFVTYKFGAYQIQPPRASDVDYDVATSGMTVSEIQSASDSAVCPPTTGCTDQKGNFCDVKAGVKVENLVAVSNVFIVSKSSNIRGFFAASAAGANNGILVAFDQDDVPVDNAAIKPGVAITSVVGTWAEIYCVTQLEVAKVTDLVIGAATTPVDATAITLDDLAIGAAEKYESTLVTISGSFKVTGADTQLGLVHLDVGGGKTLNISNSFELWASGTYPAVDTTYTQITGFVRYFRDSDTSDGDDSNYYLSPRSAGDLQ